jgi:ferredoxin
VQSGGRVLGDLLLPEAVLDAPVRITLPKLKTHTLTGLTCALKNQVGILPGGTKCAIHRVAGSPERLAQAVVDIAMAAPFHLGVVDAVVGLEGGGSAAGRPVAAGFVAGGRDLVALDACCGRLVGFEPREVPTTVAAAARGLGEARVGAVALDGIGDLEPLVRFARPGFDPKRLAPIGRLAYRLRERIVAPTVDRHRCQRCGECARVCPVDGIELAPGPRIGDGCVHCFACSERCPSGAMMLATPLYARRSLRQRTRGLPLARLARTGRRWRR